MKLIYNRTWLTVHLQFRAADLWAGLPGWVLPRAAARLSAAAAGYPGARSILPEHDARRLWRRLGRDLADLTPDTNLRLFLGVVIPAPAAMVIKKATLFGRWRGELARLTIDPEAQETSSTPSAYGFAALLGEALGRPWYTFDLEALRKLAFRASHGRLIDNEGVGAYASSDDDAVVTGLEVHRSQDRRSFYLALSADEAVLGAAMTNPATDLARARDAASNQLEFGETPCFLPEDELARAWRELSMDACMWAGYRAPRLALAALGEAPDFGLDRDLKSPSYNPRSAALDYERLPFELVLAPDAMTATAKIAEGTPANIRWDEQELRGLLKSRGIVHGIDAAAIWRLTAALAAGDTPVAIDIALGTKPRAAQGPYLRRVTVDKGQSNDVIRLSDRQMLPLRQQQAPAVVRPSDPVAELAWHHEGNAGCDVLGRAVAASTAETLSLEAGVGTAVGEDGRLYATVTGVPEINGLTASVRVEKVFKGNVNLTTGDLTVAGPFVIDGSVDTGATVHAAGDLSVTRLFRGASIICEGNLTLEGGAVCRTQGEIIVGGDLTAGWLVGVRVRCRGTVRVRRQIVNCDLWVDGDVILEDADAAISGGRLVCAGTVRTANLGNTGGTRTEVRFGTDPKACRRREILEHRLKTLTAALEIGQRDWRYVAGKSSASRNPSDSRRGSVLGARIHRLAALVERVDARLSKTAPESPLPDTSLVVAGVLHENVDMQSGDQWVTVDPGTERFWVSCTTKGCTVEHGIAAEPKGQSALIAAKLIS